MAIKEALEKWSSKARPAHRVDRRVGRELELIAN